MKTPEHPACKLLTLMVVAPLFLLTALRCAGQPAQRPLTHADYDAWRSIQSERLSRDGKWVAYVLMEQAGSSKLVLRSTSTSVEYRADVGVWPRSDSAPVLAFTYDSRFLLAQTRPTAPKNGESTSPNGLILVEASTGAVTRVDAAVGLQVPEQGSGWIAFRRLAGAASAVVLRSLVDGSERQFADVSEFSLAKDARTLVYTVSSKDEAHNGVFAVETDSQGSPQELLAGAGKYSQLSWDEPQTQLAFLARSKLYLWNRRRAAVSEVAGCAAPDLEPSNRGALSFSSDGARVLLNCRPRTTTTSPTKTTGVELWHWRDRVLQSSQKLSGDRDRTLQFLTVWNIAEKKAVQIATTEMLRIVTSGDCRWALGFDYHSYGFDDDADERSADIYAVDTLTGARRLLLRKFRPDRQGRSRMALSANSRFAIFFDGKDWNSISIEDGTIVNLTARIAVSFHEEQFDVPGDPTDYGIAGWMADGRSVLLYDRYDIWQVPLQGGGTPKNVTAGLGRKQHLIFRYVTLQTGRGHTIDSQERLLLRAEDNLSHDSGFYELNISSGAVPRQLIFEARKFSSPVKAEASKLLMFTASTFRQFPDLLVSDLEFREIRKVSDANPQQKDIRWGSAETIPFHAPSGAELQATIYKPDGFNPSKKYPMIVYIYERLSNRLHDFIPPRPEWGHAINISYYVSNGYLVLAPDIAYSIGRPGESALECVLAAVNAVSRGGFVDEHAIGIQGHSWGGYEVAYIVSHTDRFRAAEAGAVVADMVRSYDEISPGSGAVRQGVYENSQSRIGGTLWQYPDRFLQNSPILSADHIKTPLLILHNDRDPMVPFGDGLELYLALRRLHKEVYLFNYNGEGHDLSGWVNQKDFALRMQQFFDFHLKGGSQPSWMEFGIPQSVR